MEALRSLSLPGTGTLYWCGHGEADPPEHVDALDPNGTLHGRMAVYVLSQGFDDLLTRLAFRCLHGGELGPARRLRANSAATPSWTEHHLPWKTTRSMASFRAMRSRSSVPQTSLNWTSRAARQWYVELAQDRDRGSGCCCGPLSRQGPGPRNYRCYQGHLRREVAPAASNVRRLMRRNSDMRTVTSSICFLRHHTVVRGVAEPQMGSQGSCGTLVNVNVDPLEAPPCLVYQSAMLSLRRFGLSQHLIIHPSVMVWGEMQERLDAQVEKDIKQKILGYQHNDKFNSTLNLWRKKLLPEETTTIEFPPGCGSTFRFRIKRAPLFAGVGDARRGSRYS